MSAWNNGAVESDSSDNGDEREGRTDTLLELVFGVMLGKHHSNSP